MKSYVCPSCGYADIPQEQENCPCCDYPVKKYYKLHELIEILDVEYKSANSLSNPSEKNHSITEFPNEDKISCKDQKDWPSNDAVQQNQAFEEFSETESNFDSLKMDAVEVTDGDEKRAVLTKESEEELDQQEIIKKMKKAISNDMWSIVAFLFFFILLLACLIFFIVISYDPKAFFSSLFVWGLIFVKGFFMLLFAVAFFSSIASLNRNSQLLECAKISVEKYKEQREENARKDKEKAEREEKLRETIERNKPRCPYCHSTNIKEYSVTEQLGSAMLLGVFSPTLNSSHKCKDCKRRW